MKGRTFLIASALGFLLSVAAVGIGAAVDTPPTLMSRDDFRQAREMIEADVRRTSARCRDMAGAAREICKAEVRAAERVRKAELHARYHGTFSAAEEAKLAHVRAEFDVAKARCNAQNPHDRAECLRMAREHKGQALEKARLAAT